MIGLKKVFNTRKPKGFTYIPRYIKDEKNLAKEKFNNPEDESKEYSSYDYRNQWMKAQENASSKKNVSFNTRFLIILFILLVLVFWFFEFDTRFFTG